MQVGVLVKHEKKLVEDATNKLDGFKELQADRDNLEAALADLQDNLKDAKDKEDNLLADIQDLAGGKADLEIVIGMYTWHIIGIAYPVFAQYKLSVIIHIKGECFQIHICKLICQLTNEYHTVS